MTIRSIKIFVVIVTYNGDQWIKKCLGSIPSNIWKNTYIIDNNSTDDTLKTIRNQFESIQLIRTSSNLGFGQANNLGISHSLNNGAKYILLLNQDAWIIGNTLDILYDCIKNNPEFGIVSPIHLNGSGEALDKRFSKYLAPQRCEGLISDALLGNELNQVYKADFVNAAAWLVKAEVFKKIGGFDPLFFHYGEDVNFIQRAKFHGYKVGVCPHAFICHDRPQSFRGEYNRENVNKINFADVNKDAISLIKERKSLLRKQVIKALLKGPKTLLKARKDLLKLELISKEYLNSWQKNRSIGSHYLNIND